LLRGKARIGLGEAEAAMADFDAVLAAQPGQAEALVGRAHAFLLLDRAAEGLAPAERAVTFAPQLAEAWFTRANLFSVLGRPAEAIADYDRALQLKPALVDAWVSRGNAHYALRDFDAARADYERAIALKPDHADAHLNRGNVLVALEAHVDALSAFDRVIALRPGDADAFRRRGNVFLTLGRLDEALADLRQARSFDPHLPLAQSAIMAAGLELCDWTDYAADRDRLLAHVDQGRIAEGPFILFHVSDDAARHRTCAEAFAAHNFPPVSAPLWQGEIYRHPRIRLGYLSRTFRDHPTTILLGGLFARHDRTRFETVGLSISPDDGSAARRTLESAFERFIDLSRMSDAAAAEQVRALEIDILIDLDGFIEGSRTGIAARRPAPVQASYLGYPGTMGAPYIDYILADPVLVPPGEERHYAEQVVRLPDSYQPNSNRPEPGPRPSRAELGLPQTGFVFASFNNNRKITPDLFDIWMRLLMQMPGSVLWLLAMNEPARNNLRRQAVARGVAPERLVFAEIVHDQAAHLARQQAADLCLDSLFYNAHTTASDALWAGLPLLTCRGHSFASRVGASILCAAGVPELVTDNLGGYESLALALGRDPARLKNIRDRLIQNRATCPLFDNARMLRHLESAYARMAEIAARGEAPRSFDVEPQ
jgi:predicted O-linked N-acetylglucosamine transferase (SPINDLY family)